MKRTGPVDAGSPEDKALRGNIDTIEKVTGHRPHTCPWRAFYAPVVREVLEVAWAIDPPNLVAAIGSDPPAQTVAAIGVYRRALMATNADEQRIERETREAKRRAESAARKR